MRYDAANNAVRVLGRGVDERPQDEHRDADEDDDRRRPLLRGAEPRALDARAHGFTSNATTETTRGSNGA